MIRFHNWSDTVVSDPYFHKRKEITASYKWYDRSQDLGYVAATALDAAGVEFDDLRIDLSVADKGTTSIVHALHLGLEGQWTKYALRVQPLAPTTLKRYDYSSAERLVQQRCVAAGICTPRLVATEQDVEPEERPLFTFSVEEFLTGESGSSFIARRPDERHAVAYAMGALLARIHSQEAEGGVGRFKMEAIVEQKLMGEHDSYRERVFGHLLYSLRLLRLSEYLDRGHVAAIADYYRSTPLLDALDSERMSILHGDYGVHNVRVLGAGAHSARVAVVDFGDAQSGPGVQDLAVASFFLYRSNIPDAWPSLLTGYRSGGGVLPDHFEASLRMLRLRMTLCMLPALLRYREQFPDAVSKRELGIVEDLLFADAEALRIPGFYYSPLPGQSVGAP